MFKRSLAVLGKCQSLRSSIPPLSQSKFPLVSLGLPLLFCVAGGEHSFNINNFGMLILIIFTNFVPSFSLNWEFFF